MLRRVGAVFMVLVLSACDSTWFGADEADPLPGERISVLLHARTLEPDSRAEGIEIQLPRPVPNASWPQNGGYANHAMHHIQINDDLGPAWTTDIGSASSDEERFISTPVVAGGRVFAIDSETQVSAFDAQTGKRLWKAELTPEYEDDGHISGGLAFGDDVVFVAAGFGEIVALDAQSGAEKWRKSVGAPSRTPPTVRGGRVFAVTIDNKLHALNAWTGETLWDYTGAAEIAGLLGSGSPAVDQGIVVAPFSSGELVALKVDTGRMVWSEFLTSPRRVDALAALPDIRGNPVIDRGRVYAISHAGITIALELQTGRRIWERLIGGIQTPWIAGDYLYVLTNNAELACLDRASGRVFWAQSLPRFEDEEDKEDPIVWSGPVLASDRLIVVGSNGQALTFSPYTGNPLGAIDMADPITVPPVIAEGGVYFLTDDAELTAYR